MNISTQQLEALRRYGYTDRESQFLYLVATHSGFFLQRQYAEFLDISGRGRVSDFISKATANKHVKEYFYQARKLHIYHLFSRPVYAALGKEDSGNRKPGRYQGAVKAYAKLLILDFVLANPGYQYLEEEPDKIHFFTTQKGISQKFLPVRVFEGRNGSTTSRYFIDKFPICFSPPSGLVHFTYIEDASGNLAAFTRHLQQYHSLMCALRGEFRLVYVAYSSRNFALAEKLFFNHFSQGDTRVERSRLERYFWLREMAEARRFKELTHRDIFDWQTGLRRYTAPQHETEYQFWKKTRRISAPILEEKPGEFEARLVMPQGGRISVVSAAPSARLSARPSAPSGGQESHLLSGS